jgi:hypothetical protein
MDLHPLVPERHRETRLAFDVTEELGCIGQLFPYLRKERSAMAAELHDEPVDAGSDDFQRLALRGDRELLRRREVRDLDVNARDLVHPQRCEARVLEGGGHRVVAHVFAEAAAWLESPDASA